MGCVFCHKGDAAATDVKAAHDGIVKKPSDNLKLCGMCHKPIAENYGKSLHYTSAGQKHGVAGRFSDAEVKTFDEKVFEKSCRTCHASCGDCHVRSPAVGGISVGLIEGHKYVKKNEGKTCAFCHGGRVYPEYTGEYGGSVDVHYQKGMMCLECHKKEEMHGDGQKYLSKNEVKQRPRCENCHKPGGEAKLTARVSHDKHRGKASCQSCHSSGPYRQCYDCHPTGSKAKAEIFIGRNPRTQKEMTTLRLIPTVRDTFAKAGIKMEHFDKLPNYWDSAVHNIKKRTERTRNCDTCHVDKKDFLTRDRLIPNGSKANEGLVYELKPIPISR
ncbi:MAG TPA: cytochrome c3 family protein [Syntrophales bacterium]|nr:cytochrome c3 family protein [Syntrophales bacterium]HOX93990.1 cytochrome c3 family protein [Syntrophales bacterium]HPI57047.1 cytochrome c3 family protein [Syntrophales bacterium]HPN23823.1 cytochrome c3 family protein [Syntrophales bacterium]HQM30034.1 cytochrome c3 family protein [Syntrophales bacterium]